MLTTKDRRTLKSTVSKLKELLFQNFQNHATSKYLLDIKDEKKRLNTLQELNLQHYHEWNLIQKKLASSGLYMDEYILERSYTYLNRTFFLVRLEILKIQKFPVFLGMKESRGWKEFREFCPNLCKEEDEGYLFLTRQVSDYYARELPGLFLDDSADRSFGIPRSLIFQLFQEWNNPDLLSIFQDDTTAGWIYQYWNDPDREAINDRVKDKGKVQGSEIASATQLFTERYMVEWLIQNSLGNLWLAICRKNGWTTRATTTIETLKKRRIVHNQKIQDKAISNDTPLPIETEEEEFWKYYMERELTEEEIQSSITSIREVKLLDPACGSGHFLLYAFYFLLYLYREEDRILTSLDANHTALTDTEIAKSILENNLHGIDLDARAVQIAVASLYTTARRYGRLQLASLNLVATRPSIGSSTEKSTLQEFLVTFTKETKIPMEIAQALIDLLGKSDVLGSLLQVRAEIANQLERFGFLTPHTEDSIFSLIEEFVKHHDIGNDLGLFTLGRQLSRGLRLLKLLDQKYDVVVANPPYLSKSKFSSDADWIFPDGINELYELFMYRILDLVKENSYYGILSAQNFMFISQFESLRTKLIKESALTAFLHLGSDTFADVLNALGFIALVGNKNKVVDNSKITILRLERIPYKYKQVNSLNQPPKRIYQFDQSKFAEIPGSPMIYWWTETFRQWYLEADKVGDVGETRLGSHTSDNARFLKKNYEIKLNKMLKKQSSDKIYNSSESYSWIPYLKGAKGLRWFEPINEVLLWKKNGQQLKILIIFMWGSYTKYLTSIDKYFQQGIAYSYIGVDDFYCRLRKYQSIFDVSGSSIFVDNPEEVQVALSSRIIPFVSQSINPTINNQVGDIKNLPIPKVAHWKEYINRARKLYDEEFSRDETNVEYEYGAME